MSSERGREGNRKDPKKPPLDPEGSDCRSLPAVPFKFGCLIRQATGTADSTFSVRPDDDRMESRQTRSRDARDDGTFTVFSMPPDRSSSYKR